MDTTAYGDNLRGIVSGGFITSAVALGQKLGIFEVLKNMNRSMTAGELANVCNLKERYLQEWLGCMVSSRIVMMDEQDKYYIPQDCKQLLGPVKYATWVFLAADMQSQAMDCFKANGPLGYDFRMLPDDLGSWLDARIEHDKFVEDLMVPFREINGKTDVILEIGMGQGGISRAIAKLYPESIYYGLENHQAYLERAKKNAIEEGITNVTYLLGDVEDLPEDWTAKFDWVIMYAVLHDLPHPKPAIEEVRRVLKDDGIATIVDPKLHSSHRENYGNLTAGAAYATSCFICLPCSSAAEDSEKLGMGWGEENKQNFLEDHGWRVRDKRILCNNALAYSFTCTKNFKY